MAYKQLTDINTGAQANAGWCLTMQQQLFKSPVANPDAWTAWLKTKFKHYDRNLPNVPVVLWFSWTNRIIDAKGKKDPNYGVNQGHTVGWVPSVRKFLSSPGSGYGQKWFGSIAEVESYFGCKFVGWSEDINGKRVAEYVPDAAPAPAPAPNTGQGGDYHLAVEVAGYVNAGDASARQNSNSRVPAGDYKIFNQANGMVNVTRDASQPGWWINGGDNVAPAAPAPAPAPAGIAQGDTVAPNAKDFTDYNGTPVHAWADRYIVSELRGDRAVLTTGGQVFAAVRVSDIHKV